MGSDTGMTAVASVGAATFVGAATAAAAEAVDGLAFGLFNRAFSRAILALADEADLKNDVHQFS